MFSTHFLQLLCPWRNISFLLFFKLTFCAFLLYDRVDLKIIMGLKYDLSYTFGEDLK